MIEIAVIMVVVTLSLLVVKFWSRYFDIHEPGERYPELDGLRGYLALAVFISHFWIWFQFIKTGRWELTSSAVNTHFGQASVALFFMITAFLFTRKIITISDQYDYTKLLIGRVFRLVPLYLFVIFCMVLIVIQMEGGNIVVAPLSFFKTIVKWALFTLPGAPLINGFDETNTIVAGVVWSLKYEWLFYFSLPLLGLFITRKNRTLISVVVPLFIFIFSVFLVKPEAIYILFFLFGGLSVFLVRLNSMQILARSNFGSIFALFILGLLGFFDDSNGFFQAVILFLFFSFIVSGCSFFGIFRLNISRLLGVITYSIYLLHGILLYIFYRFLISSDVLLVLTVQEYAALSVLITPFLISAAIFSCIFIEKPFINYGKKFLRSL